MANEWQEVELKASGKRVYVPREMFEAGDAFVMRHYAYQSGQVTRAEAGVSDEFRPGSEVTDPVMAGLITSGKVLTDFGSNIKQAFNEATGNEVGAQREKDSQAEANRLIDPLREEHPVASFAGAAAPSFAVPGGKAAQVGAGVVEGALQGDSLASRAGLGVLGGGLALVGQKVGDKVGQRFTNAVAKRQPSSSSLAGSTARLLDNGVPVPVAQRPSIIPGLRRDPVARFANSIEGIITNNKLPGGEAQIKRVNKLALKALGESGDEVSIDKLFTAHTRIGRVFERAAEDVSEVPIGQVLKDPDKFLKFSNLADDIDDLGVGDTFAGQIRRFYGEVSDAAAGNGIISGQRYNQIRQKLGAASRAAWRKGDEVAAESADSVLEIIDDAMAEGNPTIADSLRVAREQWRMLKVLRGARKLDPDGNINARSIENAYRKIYPGADVGKFPNNAAGRFGQTLNDLTSTAIPRQTSRTAENLIRTGGLAGLGTAAVAGGGAPALAGAGTIGALGLLGGGTGGLLGGGAPRGILQGLLQEKRELTGS